MTAFALHAGDFGLKASLDGFQDGKVDHFELADANFLAAHVEVLVVTEDQILHGGAFNGALDLEHFHAQSHNVAHARDLGQFFNGLLVGGGAGGGLEDNGIGEDGAQHAASDALGNFHAVEVKHVLQHGAGAAHGPDPGFQGRGGGHITKLVVISDTEHTGGIHSLGGLSQIGIVHQIQILASHVGNNLGSGETELLEHEFGFRSGRALSGRGNVQTALAVQVGGGNGRNDAVGIRIHVTNN